MILNLFDLVSFVPLVALTCVLTSGCQTREAIPTYPATQPSFIVDAIRARAGSLNAATGKGAISLSSRERGSVRLDAAFVLVPPDRARVRAWKFGQAVFDLTVKPQGVWLYSPRDSNAASASSTSVAGGIRDWLVYLGSGVPTDATFVRENDRSLVLQSPDPHSGGTMWTTIDRPTRTVREYRLVDAAGVERFTLLLDQYRDFAGTLWPTRITAKSATGSIILEADSLQPGVAAPSAFTPPARATRLP